FCLFDRNRVISIYVLGGAEKSLSLFDKRPLGYARGDNYQMCHFSLPPEISIVRNCIANKYASVLITKSWLI
ncbi:hypothetical protein, partial [Flexistipes sinusarabici]|uniref:hypothetical protein n=1 Tax=Flexistipes sinusarabici TaxID=2352 RepID=UPI0026EBB8E6